MPSAAPASHDLTLLAHEDVPGQMVEALLTAVRALHVAPTLMVAFVVLAQLLRNTSNLGLPGHVVIVSKARLGNMARDSLVACEACFQLIFNPVVACRLIL